MSENKVYTAEEKIQRAYDVIQIKNAMARHAFYHAASRHDIEMETLWAHNAPNVSWGNGMGFQVGRDVVWDYYVRPHIGHGCKPGEMFMHTLTTPVIEIAEDGQTAQAMWYTPGFGTGTGPGAGPDAQASGQWMYERYAIDFIKEDGEWKIWHFFVGTDFSFDAGTEYQERKGPGGPPPGEQKAERGVYRVPGIYTATYGWSEYPPVPKKYKTFSETVSYGPEAYMKAGE